MGSVPAPFLCSGGVAVCGECGRNLTTYTSGSSKTRKFWYYSCPAARRGGCGHKTMHRAEALEAAVAALVDGELLTDRETLERHLDAAAERAVDPGLAPGAAETLSGRPTGIAERRAAYQDQQAAGLMTLPELAEKLRALEEQRSIFEEKLETARHAAERAAETERAKRAVLSMFGTGLMLGLHWFPPRLRRHVYGLIGPAGGRAPRR